MPASMGGDEHVLGEFLGDVASTRQRRQQPHRRRVLMDVERVERRNEFDDKPVRCRRSSDVHDSYTNNGRDLVTLDGRFGVPRATSRTDSAEMSRRRPLAGVQVDLAGGVERVADHPPQRHPQRVGDEAGRAARGAGSSRRRGPARRGP